ncbi:MAG: hypothetical protein KF869_10665 [Phycisphaeraceae bacterium]|nr:hypothetical protein [Phycisphaeraceae bacterium]
MSDDEHLVWHRFKKAGIFAVLMVGAGVIFGCLLVRWLPVRPVQWVQVPGGALLLWAILAEMHEEIATWEGDTPHEHLNRRLFLCLSGVGTFLLAVGTSAGLAGP